MSEVVDVNLATGHAVERAETAGERASREALSAAEALRVVSRATNLSRLVLLGKKAAKYARNPATNPALTAREQHELLARLVLAEKADDES
jgi:hypothetical protein